MRNSPTMQKEIGWATFSVARPGRVVNRLSMVHVFQRLSLPQMARVSVPPRQLERSSESPTAQFARSVAGIPQNPAPNCRGARLARTEPDVLQPVNPKGFPPRPPERGFRRSVETLATWAAL